MHTQSSDEPNNVHISVNVNHAVPHYFQVLFEAFPLAKAETAAPVTEVPEIFPVKPERYI